MNAWLTLHHALLLAGAIHFAILIASALVPKVLNWETALAALPPFLRTLFWVAIAVFVAIMARNNWSDVTLNLWGSLQADIKIPLLILIAFLLGFLPTWFIMRGRIWQLKRKLAVQAVPPMTMPAAAPESRAPDELSPA